MTIVKVNNESSEEAGLRCLNYITKHIENRPHGTGIENHDYRSNDVIVTTFPKSGTTLMQHMSYQIVALSGGGPSFDPTGLEFPDLSVVSPWIDYIPIIGIPPCESSPRVLKTHSPVTDFSEFNCRHIVVVRDPTAFPSSWLDFMFEAVVPEANTVSDATREATFHACVKRDLLTPGPDGLGRWHHFVKHSVFPLREDVLVVFYEDIVADMMGTVRSVSTFMGCNLSEADVAEVVKRCDRSSMASDTRFFCRIEAKAFGVGHDTPKAKKARRDGFKRFRVKEEDARRIDDMTFKTFGVNSYKEFREMICKRQRSVFKY